MATQAVNYQCPACTGPLHFAGSSGRLECDYCGSSFTVEEVEALYAAKDEKAAEAQQRAEAKEAEAHASGEAPEEPPEVLSREERQRWKDSKWDESTISDDWGEASANMRSYSCPSCGAELMCDAATAATQCPYCGNPSIVPGQFTNTLKPDYVIPFKVDKEAAVEALKKHCRRRLFLPRTFSSGNKLQKVQGVYVPFWLFDCEAAGTCRFEATRSETHREGDYLVTRTQHFDVRRSGRVSFEHVPTDASARMPDNLMDAMEPFNYAELKPFSTAYLPGFVADKYDVSVDECAPRADKRCTASTEAFLRNDVHGYSTVITVDQDICISRGKVHYALLPVWILTTRWEDKNFIFGMNGQTGRFAGNLPVSKARFFGFFAGLSAVLSILAYLTGLGGYIAGLF